MSKILLTILLFSFVTIISCSDDDNNVTPNNPSTGEVLLASVLFDSVEVTSGLRSNASSISSGTLNFTDRDSARISFFYSGENNVIAEPMQIYSSADTIFRNTLNPTAAEQFIDVTIPSPKVNALFSYSITTASSPGSSYFAFRNLKIYKK